MSKIIANNLINFCKLRGFCCHSLQTKADDELLPATCFVTYLSSSFHANDPVFIYKSYYGEHRKSR